MARNRKTLSKSKRKTKKQLIAEALERGFEKFSKSPEGKSLNISGLSPQDTAYTLAEMVIPYQIDEIEKWSKDWFSPKARGNGKHG